MPTNPSIRSATTSLRFSVVDSPIDPLLLVGDGDAVCAVHMQDQRTPVAIDPEWIRDDGALAPLARQLDEYFAGERTTFDVSLRPSGTPFQRSVWQQLGEIPYGTTVSYGEVARRLGDPNRSRAVGLANGRNPIPIVVPCHRVIGADGSLTGFGGGLPRKRFLLDLESGAHPLL